MEGTISADSDGQLLGSGDVKYHLGFTMDRPTHTPGRYDSYVFSLNSRRCSQTGT